MWSQIEPIAVTASPRDWNPLEWRPFNGPDEGKTVKVGEALESI